MKIDYENASFKDFENIPGLDPYAWAELWTEYVNYRPLEEQLIVSHRNTIKFKRWWQPKHR